MSHTDVSLAEFDKNLSKAYTLDKHNDDILSLNSLEQIYEEAKAKKFYGNIIWPAKLPYQNEAFANKIEQIENVIGENNLTSSRYPSDLIHALLCKHASSNVFKRKAKHEKKEIQVPVDHLKPGDAVQLKNQDKFNEANEWTILDVYDVSTGLIGEGKTLDGQLNRVQICLGILYVNENRKQLVLAHKSIQADWKSFFIHIHIYIYVKRVQMTKRD